MVDMSKNGKIILIFYILILSIAEGKTQVQRHRTTTLMGCRFDFTVIAEDSLHAEKYIDQAISEITHGAFDISFAAIDKIWKFDGSMKHVPSPNQIKKSIKKIGYKNIILDTINSTIFLKLAGMKIGFGSIGKGYAADKAKEVLAHKKAKAGIINASGDISVWGSRMNRENWKIGIVNPFVPSDIIGAFSLKEECVTTSGSYEKFVELEGKRYSHIIDPRTGYPVKGILSVSVVGPKTEMANGFSTSIMVLGTQKGIELINHFPDYGCLIITDEGELIKSKNFNTKIELYDSEIKPTPKS